MSDHDRFVIAPHHPDRLRRPAAAVSATYDEAFQQALTWNVFRTLELIAPAFWLRRLHLRLTGEPFVVPPQIARIQLWQSLPLPPIQRIDGARPEVLVDVLIETEHGVWTLATDSARRSTMDSSAMAAFVDAGAWFAGLRPHTCGIVGSTAAYLSPGAVLQDRYSRSRASAQLQSATRGPAVPAQARWGTLPWFALAALLQDCSEADHLPQIERALAWNAVEWMARVGVHPDVNDATRAVTG